MRARNANSAERRKQFYFYHHIKSRGCDYIIFYRRYDCTWVIARKWKGFEDRLQGVENAQKNCQGYTLVRIDQKLDRIHERIDEVLLRQEKNKDN